MSNLPATTAPLYATDEDVAVRAGGDFVTLAPQWQTMGAGTDGVLSIGPPWSLSSASNPFQTNGVTPNGVVVLTGPKAAFPGGGHLLAIDTVAGNVLTLRRLHKDVGVGLPPCGANGLSGVTFFLPTLGQQIEESSWEVKQRFGIDEQILDRQSSWIYDQRILRNVTVLTVLLQRYIQEARGDKGDFPRKIGLIRSQLELAIAQCQVRFGPQGNSEEPTGIFSTKLAR